MLQVVEGARFRGASKIIGVDLNSKKFEQGCTDLQFADFYSLPKTKNDNVFLFQERNWVSLIL